MAKNPDIDIDVVDRIHALEGMEHVQASLLDGQRLARHNTGVFFQRIPTDPITGLAAFPSGRKSQDVAGQLGYFKIDVLNNNAYEHVRSREHLEELVAREPDWSLFLREDVVKRLYHVGNWFDVIDAYEPRSIADLACLLAIIRPAKKHLLGEPWDVVRREIWKPDPDGGYSFKKSHAVAFATCIVAQLNSLVDAGIVSS